MNGIINLSDGQGATISGGVVTANSVNSSGTVTASTFSGNLQTNNIQPISNASALSLYTNSTGASTWGNVAGTLQFNPALTFVNSLNGISSTVFGYLSGLTSNVQTQINNISTSLGSTYLTIANAMATYQTISGMSSYLTTASASSLYQTILTSASNITINNLTGNVLTANSVCGVSNTVMGYLSTATSDVQTQINNISTNISSTYLSITNASTTYMPILNTVNQIGVPTGLGTVSNYPASNQIGYLTRAAGTWTTVNNYSNTSTTVTNLYTYANIAGTWLVTVQIFVPNSSCYIRAFFNTTNSATYSPSQVVCASGIAGDTASSNWHSVQFTYISQVKSNGTQYSTSYITEDSTTIYTALNIQSYVYLQVMTSTASATGNWNVQAVRIA